jgi:hypothetical protein
MNKHEAAKARAAAKRKAKKAAALANPEAFAVMNAQPKRVKNASSPQLMRKVEALLADRPRLKRVSGGECEDSVEGILASWRKL